MLQYTEFSYASFFLLLFESSARYRYIYIKCVSIYFYIQFVDTLWSSKCNNIQCDSLRMLFHIFSFNYEFNQMLMIRNLSIFKQHIFNHVGINPI